MLNSARQKEFGAAKADLPPLCRNCEWKRLCRGGCPKDRRRDPRDAGLSHFCAGYKRFFAHADTHFKSLAKSWNGSPS
jgi:uncharacterized protein